MEIKASDVRPVDGHCALSIAWGQSLRFDLHDPGYDHVYHVVTEGVFCVIFVCHMKPWLLVFPGPKRTIIFMQCELYNKFNTLYVLSSLLTIRQSLALNQRSTRCEPSFTLKLPRFISEIVSKV